MFNKQKFKVCLLLANKNMSDTAEHLGISRSTLYRKMNGESDFYRNEIQMICEFLNITNPQEIFFA